MNRRAARQSKECKIGLIVQRAPSSSDTVETVLRIAANCLADGCQVDVFTLGDGVWLTRKKQPHRIRAMLRNIARRGGRILASEAHLKASGSNSLLRGVEPKADPYSTLVDLIMDEWDRVIVI